MIKFLNQHDCKKELKEFSLKATPARLSVIKYLENVNNPVDVGNIVSFLNKEEVDADPATIFRMMNLFVDKGIVQRIELGEGKYRYEKSKNHHHHLICTLCGKIEDVEGDFVSNLESQIKQKNEFIVKSHSLEFFGICKNCQS